MYLSVEGPDVAAFHWATEDIGVVDRITKIFPEQPGNPPTAWFSPLYDRMERGNRILVRLLIYSAPDSVVQVAETLAKIGMFEKSRTFSDHPLELAVRIRTGFDFVVTPGVPEIKSDVKDVLFSIFTRGGIKLWMKVDCPVCGCQEANRHAREGGDRERFTCFECRDYEISGSALSILEANARLIDRASIRTELSMFVRGIANSGELITSDTLTREGLLPPYDGTGAVKAWNRVRAKLGKPKVRLESAIGDIKPSRL